VAEATGVQRGSLYNAYGDKERLFLLAYDATQATFSILPADAVEPRSRVALTALFKSVIAT